MTIKIFKLIRYLASGLLTAALQAHLFQSHFTDIPVDRGPAAS